MVTDIIPFLPERPTLGQVKTMADRINKWYNGEEKCPIANMTAWKWNKLYEEFLAEVITKTIKHY